MIKKNLIGILIAGSLLHSSMTAFAAPVTMPDGTVFDPEYYAQAYPDVTAEVGTSLESLYGHYKTYGQYEGRHPIAPVQGAGSPARQATVLGNAVVSPENPYSGRTVTVPASGLTVDGLAYPDHIKAALGNGTVLQYDGHGTIYGGYVAAAASADTVTVSYDLMASADGVSFHRLPASTVYIFYIREAATSKVAGIFTDPENGGFSLSANGGARTFNVNDPRQVWLIDSATGRLLTDSPLPNGDYFITVGPTTSGSPTASNIFTVYR